MLWEMVKVIGKLLCVCVWCAFVWGVYVLWKAVKVMVKLWSVCMVCVCLCVVCVFVGHWGFY